MMDERTRKRIQEMIRYCGQVENRHGLPAANRARETLLASLDLALGAERLWPDGDLGLGGTLSGGIVFGVVPHRSREVPVEDKPPLVWAVHS